MANEQAAFTLSELFTDLDPGYHVIGPRPDTPLTLVSLWWPSTQLPTASTGLIIIPPQLDEADTRELVSLLTAAEPCTLAIPESLSQTLAIADAHTYLVLPDRAFDPTQLIGLASRALEAPGRFSEQRLASLQRALSLSLGTNEPVPDLLQRLKRICNAGIAFIDHHGRAVHTTGPIPLALIYADVTATEADSQQLFLDGGWHGVAARVHDPTEPGGYAGWLVAVSRRPDFPDAYAISAVHLAATLVEVVLRMLTLSRDQEEAIRASLLDQAIALQPVRDDEELTRRITRLGISFDQSPRIALLRPGPRGASTNRVRQLHDLAATVQQTLRSANIPVLCSPRDDRVALLMQCSDKDLRRLLISNPDQYAGITVGVGRTVSNAGDVATSFHDAQLALRIIRRRRRAVLVMSYDDFDVAPRLFAEVGLERMEEWAKSYLGQILSRPTLMEGLRSYFDHEQNVNAAADALGIHHNSLRYRLAKIEEILDVSLKSPSALASVFLALTALELSGDNAPRLPRAGNAHASELDAAVPTDFANKTPTDGIVRGPET